MLQLQDSLSQLEREKQTMNSELQSVASKFKETETRLSSLQSELSGIAREKESVKSKYSERAHKSWTSVLNKKEKFHVRNIWTVLFYKLPLHNTYVP